MSKLSGKTAFLTCISRGIGRTSAHGLEAAGAQNSHQPTRERERRILQEDFLRGVRGFRDPKRTQEFLSCFGPIRQHFALKRHVIRASLYRNELAARFVAWREFAELVQIPSAAF